jgi:hypothetical protein
VRSRINRTRPGLLFSGTLARSQVARCRRRRAQGELGLAIAPNGDILTVKRWQLKPRREAPLPPAGISSSSLPWTTPLHLVQKNGAGSVFGLAVKPGVEAVYLVDHANTLNLLT